jgi:hypothetical protein
MLNMFWTEHDHFHSKMGPYGNRDHIWHSQDILAGNSHFWHKKNSLVYTSILGKVACIVCSKILGIGSAERSWGDVKHLKTEKRAKLSGEAVKMQGTIFGASCAERARLRQGNMATNAKLQTNWENDDFADPGIDTPPTPSVAVQPLRIFRAWLEDWEIPVRSKQDPVNEAKLLEKYGGLVWHDPDYDKIFMACRENMHWSVVRGSRGYCVKGLMDSYNPDEPEDDEHWEPWGLDSDCFYDSIIDYNKKNPSVNISVVVRNDSTLDSSVDETDNAQE